MSRGRRPSRPAWQHAIPLILAAVFALSGISKLQDGVSLALALRGFDLGIPDDWLPYLATLLPCLEICVAIGLLLPKLTRAAAWWVVTLNLIFIGAIASLLIRDLSLSCPCFGSVDFLCSGALGWCHIARDIVLILLAATWIWLLRPQPRNHRA